MIYYTMIYLPTDEPASPETTLQAPLLPGECHLSNFLIPAAENVLGLSSGPEMVPELILEPVPVLVISGPDDWSP